MTMIKTFYSYFRSSTAYRLRIALNLKGVTPGETKFVNLLKGEQRGAEYLKVNPMGAVPAFVLDDGTVLTQSLAMLEWLDESYPEPALLPEDPLLKAQARAFAQIIGCDIHPVNNLRILKYITGVLHATEGTKKDWIHHWIHQGFAPLEQLLEGRKTPFCFGAAPGLAEICLVPQWYNAERFGVDVSRYKQLGDIVEKCRALPSFDNAKPETQPDWAGG